MNLELRKRIEWFRARLVEPSSVAALCALMVLFHLNITDGNVQALVDLLAALLGMAAVAIPEKGASDAK
jgi:predicted permease